MEEYGEFSFSGETVDLLKIEVDAMLKHMDLSAQQQMELVNFLDGLDAPDGMNISFDFS